MTHLPLSFVRTVYDMKIVGVIEPRALLAGISP